MRVGIITFHFASNCGAALQCAALQKALQKIGCTVEVIDYRPLYHRNRFSPRKNPFVHAKECFLSVYKTKGALAGCVSAVKGFRRAILSWKQAPEKAHRRVCFESFLRKTITQTKRFSTYRSLERENLGFDAYVAGSDQLWNETITGYRFDPAYFLNFCRPGDICFTYAIGGVLPEDANTAKCLAPLIAPLKSIGLREKTSIPCLKMACKIAGKEDAEISCQCDPTFLLNAEEYAEMEKTETPYPERYIFVYTVADSSRNTTFDCAGKLSKETGLPLVCASNNPSPTDAIDSVFCSPPDFLAYIKNADYVITNSFHGTAFSLIYDVKFLSIPHSKTGNRVTELLDALHLSNLYCTSIPDEIRKTVEAADRDYSKSVMAEMRLQGLSYLRRQLSL